MKDTSATELVFTRVKWPATSVVWEVVLAEILGDHPPRVLETWADMHRADRRAAEIRAERGLPEFPAPVEQDEKDGEQ